MTKKSSDKGEKKTTTTKIGRDAITGKFIPVKEAQKRPEKSVVETIKRRVARQKPPKKKK